MDSVLSWDNFRDSLWTNDGSCDEWNSIIALLNGLGNQERVNKNYYYLMNLWVFVDEKKEKERIICWIKDFFFIIFIFLMIGMRQKKRRKR